MTYNPLFCTEKFTANDLSSAQADSGISRGALISEVSVSVVHEPAFYWYGLTGLLEGLSEPLPSL